VRASLISSALARAQGFLLEPSASPAARRPAPTEEGEDSAHGDWSQLGSIEAAVLGLTPRSGVSTVARGLVGALGVTRGRRAQLVALNGDSDGARDDLEWSAAAASHAVARVWDVGPGGCERATAVCARANTVVLVASRAGDPALGDVVAQMLAERFGHLVLVANRAIDSGRWMEHGAICLPQSRLGALLVAHGRRPGGPFAAALEHLAALVEAGGCV
jgi:hypothetical protein